MDNFCNIVVMLPFTKEGNRPNTEHSVELPFSHMAATMMAIDHFNSRNPTVVEELSSAEFALQKDAADGSGGCRVQIPTLQNITIVDDGDDRLFPVTAFLDVRHKLKDVIENNKNNSMLMGNTKICAVVGPYNNEPILSAAIVTAALGIPLVSYGQGDSAKIGRPAVGYPLTSKITADQYGRGDALVDYIKNHIKRDYVVLIHTTNLSDFAPKVMKAAATKYDMKLKIMPITPPLTNGTRGLPSVIKSIKESEYKIIVVSVRFLDYWDMVIEYADKYNMTGPDAGYFWIAYDTADMPGLTELTKDSVAKQNLLNGAGAMRVLDGFSYKGKEDRFLQSWRRQNSTSVARLNAVNPIQSPNTTGGDGDKYNKKNPPTPPAAYYYAKEDYFVTHDPKPYSGFIYDAVVALGMAACRAELSKQNGSSKSMLHDELVKLKFAGASGNVDLNDGKHNSRTSKSIAFGMYNIRTSTTTKGPEKKEFEYFLTAIKKPGEDIWSPQTNEFIYSDGTTKAPILKTTETHDNHWDVWITVIVMLSLFIIIAAVVYIGWIRKQKQADSVWRVKMTELKFDDPPEVIGRGTFGLVLLAEYRGTEVAVKKVIPTNSSKKNRGAIQGNTIQTASGSNYISKFDAEDEESLTGEKEHNISTSIAIDSNDSGWNSEGKTFGSGQHFPNGIVAGVEGSTCKRLKNDFISEMRLLSKLRHPCITTVMGAVTCKYKEPMLVMEFMDHGSLYDLLHNNTLMLEGALVLPILQDIAKGVRFLHAAAPQIIHGDLKAQNVLVDKKFRAKVADFGLSQKKKVGATGTPYWTAPELLRGESKNSPASDAYSFGIILYEVYSRKDPYEGERPEDVLRLVADPLVNKRPPILPSCPPCVQSLLNDCVGQEPKDRPTFEELDMRLGRFDAATVEPRKMRFSMHNKKNNQTERTDKLLFEVFPQHIAEALRDGRKVEPESRDVVTIFFSDIVGFTDISSTLPAIKISDMLDRLYSTFDALSEKHDVFKVETIGDAYMAVTNLIKDQQDHTKRIAEFSVDALQAANETMIDLDNPSKGFVNIRVGFHSGAVVANVVGSRNPRYCLFGDTVNTASRMESNSEQNRIHCSQRSAKLLRKQHPTMGIRTRGDIEIKGKGTMRTYWVNEERDPRRSQGSIAVFADAHSV